MAGDYRLLVCGTQVSCVSDMVSDSTASCSVADDDHTLMLEWLPAQSFRYPWEAELPITCLSRYAGCTCYCHSFPAAQSCSVMQFC